MASNLVSNAGDAFVFTATAFTRPADTTAYASGDLVANSTTAGSVAPISLTLPRDYGGAGRIRSVRLAKSGTGVSNASFRVHFYLTSPTCANGDNGAWSTSGVAGYLGSIDVTVDKAFTDGAKGRGAVAAEGDIHFDAGTNNKTFYALLEARAAYTPASGETFTLTVEGIQN